MKKTTTLLLGLILSLSVAFAQDGNRKGFIGLSLGPSIPLGDFKEDGMANTGLNLTLVNFGYLFSENIGIAGSWFGAAHNIDVSSLGLYDGMWSYGGLMAGPLFSTPISEKVDFDLKGLIGYSVSKMELEGYEFDGTGFAYSVGAGLRFNFSPKWAFLLNADYWGSPNKGDFMDRKIEVINTTVGIAYRLK